MVEEEEEDPSPTTNVEGSSSHLIEVVNGDEAKDARGKRKCNSNVWDHFTRKKVDGKPKAQCQHCVRYHFGDSKQGTSHLCGHLGRHPRLKFKDIGGM